MTKRRQYSGDETIETLTAWKKDQKAAERLAGSILHLENFESVDPIHPLGGRDGKKDILCKRGNKIFIVAVYFPRTQQLFKSIAKKFKNDCMGIEKNAATGIIFVTNQHLTASERLKLQDINKGSFSELYHLERIASILNSPLGYGVRLEFLDIELSKTEQLSYFASKDKEFHNVQIHLAELLKYLKETANFPNISTDKLFEFKKTLERIVGNPSSYFLFGSSMIDRLKVPLKELQDFEEKLCDLTESGFFLGSSPLQKLHVPLDKLEEFKDILYDIVGSDQHIIANAPIDRLRVPLRDLEIFNDKLDEIIEKLKEVQQLKQGLET